MTQDQKYKSGMEKTFSEMREMFKDKISTEEKYICELCQDTGFTIVEIAGRHKCRVCEHVKKMDKDKIIDEFVKNIPKIYDINNHENRKHQIEIKKLMLDEKQGCWIYGDSDFGKTHLIYMAMLKRMKGSKKILNPIVYKATELLDMWTFQYDKESIRKEIENLYSYDLYFISEVDKFHYTESRETRFFELINKFYEQEKIVYFCSQTSIDDFVKTMKKDSMNKMRSTNLISPMARKLKEICIEIRAIIPEQTTL